MHCLGHVQGAPFHRFLQTKTTTAYILVRLTIVLMWIMDFLVINNIFNSVACIAKRSIASELLEGHKIRDRYKKKLC